MKKLKGKSVVWGTMTGMAVIKTREDEFEIIPVSEFEKRCHDITDLICGNQAGQNKTTGQMCFSE